MNSDLLSLLHKLMDLYDPEDEENENTDWRRGFRSGVTFLAKTIINRENSDQDLKD